MPDRLHPDSILTANRQKLISASLFFVSYALLWRFMDLFRNAVPQSFTVFWLLILVIFVSLLYQIFKFGDDRSWEIVILFQIMLSTFFFHIFYLVLNDGSAFRGDDEYTILKCAEYIQQGNRHFLTAGGPDYGRWPLGNIFILNISAVCGLQLFDTAYYIPPFISTIGSIFVYLIARVVYHNRAALLALLAFGSFYLFGRIHCVVHPEYLGLILLFACLYVFFKRLQFHLPTTYASLALLFMIATAFINVTTNSFLVFILVTMLLSSLLTRFFPGDKGNFTITYSSILVFVAVSIVIWLVYWMNIGKGLFEGVVRMLAEVRAPVYYPHMEQAVTGQAPPPAGIGDHISGWGQPFYAVLFGVIMLYEVVRQRKCDRWDFDFFFTLWAGIGLIFFLFTGLLPVIPGGPGRMGLRVECFVYPFMLMVVAHVGFRVKSQLKRALFGLLILGFLLVNVASLKLAPPDLFSQSFQPVAVGDHQQEFSFMDYLDTLHAGPSTTVVDYGVKHYFWYRYGDAPYTKMDAFANNLADLKTSYFDFIALTSHPRFEIPFPKGAGIVPLRTLTSKRLDEATLELIGNTPWLERVYDDGEWVIYHVIRVLR